MKFNGSKIALLLGDKVLMQLRDNRPGLFNANMWDFPGGGREGDETPEDCVIREVREELAITLLPEALIWKKEFPAQKDPTGIAYFFAANITQEQADSIVLGEGQKWEFMDYETFFGHPQVVEAIKSRFQVYLDTK